MGTMKTRWVVFGWLFATHYNLSVLLRCSLAYRCMEKHHMILSVR